MEKPILGPEGIRKALGLKGFFGRLVSRTAYRMLELDRPNRIQAKFSDLQGADFSARVLEEVGVSYEIPPEQLERIPKEGGFVTVSNHHYGSIDGMILSAVIGARRPDYKILTTFLLSMIPSLRDSFIPVDNFRSGTARSVSGIRTALGHLADGHPLGLFPAGEVGTWQKGKNRTSIGRKRVVEDIPWADSSIKLAQKSGFPVIPIYFEGENSRSFHILGRIHPRLRTARLIHEVFNKRGRVVKVRIGMPIPAAEVASFDIPSLGRYLRNRCYALEAQCIADSAETKAAGKMAPLAEPVPAARVRAEMEARTDRMLFELGDYRAYLLQAGDTPETMRELYRLREETFRGIGEGTGQSQDTDMYDAYYRQMVLWNVPNREIVGAYRLGFGPEIMASHGGVPGFYSASLVKYDDAAKPLLSRSIELGRSFIVKKYQREVQPLKLLLTGLAVAATKCPGSAYFSGTVSISNDIPLFYKSLIAKYLEKSYPIGDAARIAMPTHPFKPDFLAVDPDGLLQIPEGQIDLLDRLIGHLSDGAYRIPVLVRKYFSGGARLVCFNVDPDFCDSLDALIFLRLSEFPKTTCRAFLRGLPEGLQEAVLQHFYGKD
ncbi:MAG: lysophospholipid acyltransferase family protein [Bacteroidales bacterium]|nr:lysophospholipid acyltransferase family protein [Bacteroidales bacterium]